MYTRIAFLLVLVAAVFAQQRSIVETAAATPQLSTLVSVLTNSNYAPVLQLLQGPGPFTVFAPNNAAFAAANIDPNQVALVTAVLSYHVVNASIPSSRLAQGANIAPTLMSNAAHVNIGAGRPQVINVIRTGNTVQLSFSVPTGQYIATVVLADVLCTNGVVHIIDRVLFFPADVVVTAERGGLIQLLEAVVKANLAQTVSTTASLTIFAPTNLAFERANWSALTPAQLVAVLTYHVVPAVAYSTSLSNGQNVPTLNSGNGLRVLIENGRVDLANAQNQVISNVVLPNILTKNGVVHVIDRVMVPPNLLREVTAAGFFKNY